MFKYLLLITLAAFLVTGVLRSTSSQNVQTGANVLLSDGTNQVLGNVLTLGNGMKATGSRPTPTIVMSVNDPAAKTANYTVTAADMANALNLAGTSGTPILTLPAVSATIFSPGMTVAVQVTGTVNWSITNSTGLGLAGTGPLLCPGDGGTFVANADSSHLDFFGKSCTNQQSFGQIYGSTRVVSAGTTDTLVATDCGGEVIYNLAAFTVTIPAAIVPASGTVCRIAIRTNTANKVSVNGSAVTAATLVSADSYTGTQAIAGSAISLDLTTVAATTKAFLDGHGS